MTIQLNGRRADPDKHRVPALEECLRHAEEAVAQAKVKVQIAREGGFSEASVRDAEQELKLAQEQFEKHKEAAHG